MEPVKRCPEPETLSMHAYGNLDRHEHDTVERHLISCHRCRAEVDTLSETLNLMALLAPQESPSPSLRARVMAAVAETPQTERPRRLEVPRWLTWGAGAAAVALVLTFGLSAFFDSSSGLYTPVQRAVVDAKRQGAHVLTLEGTKDAPKAHGELYVVNPSGAMKRIVVAVEGLGEPSGGEVYCLWLIKDGRRTVGGWINVDRRGRGGLVFETSQNFDTVGVTLEPGPEYFSGDVGEMTPRGPKVLGVAKQ